MRVGPAAFNATAFMVVQAALAVLLGKLGGTSDVAVGFRSRGVRIRFWMIWWGFSSTRWCCGWIWVGIPRWPRCWRRSGAQFGGFRASGCALRGARRAAQPHPLADSSSTVPVALGWQNFAENRGDPTAAMALGDVQISPLDADIQTARWDLTFQLAERFTEAGQPAGIGGVVEFRTDVFDAASIEGSGGAVASVLEAMAADPGQHLSGIDVLDDAEHAQLDGGATGLRSTARVGAAVDPGGVRRAGGSPPRGGGDHGSPGSH